MILSFLLCFGLCFLLLQAGQKSEILDLADGGRKTQIVPAVPLGGIGIYLSFFTVYSLLRFEAEYSLFLTLGGGFLVLFGFLDDLVSLVPYQKIILQSCAISVGALVSPWTYFSFLELLFLLVAINAYNLLDGIDGLCAGVCALSFAVLYLAFRYGECTVLLFATLAFFIFNFPPAKLYLGDAGAQFLGLCLGTLVLRAYRSGASPLCFAVCLLPIADGVRVALCRIVKKKSPLAPDRTHLHHLISATKLGDGGAVLLYLLLSGSVSWLVFLSV